MTYQDWKARQLANNDFTSYDWYKAEFPTVKEYVCVYLSPEYKCGHDDDAEILFASDCLGEASTFVYEQFKRDGRDIAVWQERSQGYRQLYQNKVRDSKGRFVKI